MPKVVQIAVDKEEYILPRDFVLPMGDSSMKNEIQHHS
jgi:hypothetical protein